MKPISTTWLPFFEARAFVHQLGLKSRDKWKEYSKSGKRPPNIPSNPEYVYKSEFKGFGDWLGTGTIATFSRSYRPFSEARAFVHQLGLKNSHEWRAYCKSGKKPPDIPAYPGEVDAYHSEYKDMGDWLGTGNVAPNKRVWRPFAEARSYVRSLKIKNQDEWLVYCKSGQKPADIPSNPDRSYLDEFDSYGDWLGNDNIHRGELTYHSFTEARAFVHTQGLKNSAQWYAYCRSGKKPSDIPSRPKQVYRSVYEGMEDWLGTERIRHNRSFTEARNFARSLGLISYQQWKEYCQSGKKPPDIPSEPWRAYYGEYKSIDDWLGAEYLSFSEARAFVQMQGLKDYDDWLHYCMSGKKPINIPSKPWQVYRTEYKGIKDWLGVVDKWNSDTLLTFLHDLQPKLVQLTKKDLVSILQRNGALNPFRKVLGGATPIRVLNDLMKNEGRDLEQALRKRMNENIQILVDSTTIETEEAKVINTAEFFEHENSSALSTQIVTSSSTRTQVFISYSHKDARYLEQLVEHLAYYERNNLIESWSDKKITPGAQWREEIKRAIEYTKVAVLLISPSFLASEFIAENELPPLLYAAEKEGAIILPVIVRPSNFEDTELANFQAVNSPSTPVAKMKGYQRDELWAKVVRHIKVAILPEPPQVAANDTGIQKVVQRFHRKDEQFEQLELDQPTLSKTKAVPTGFEDLDRLIGGFHSSDLIIVEAPPAAGKTNFALSIASNAATKFAQSIGIFSLETNEERLTQRLYSLSARIELQRLHSEMLEDDEWERLVIARDILDGHIWIDDSSSLSVAQLRTQAHKMVLKHSIDLIIVDYINLLHPEVTQRGYEQKDQSYREISRCLKVIARELNIPILALVQMQRKVNNFGKEPGYSDIQDIPIENDADVVMYIDRADRYNPESERRDIVDIIITKHRSGSRGEISLYCDPRTGRFRDLMVNTAAEK